MATNSATVPAAWMPGAGQQSHAVQNTIRNHSSKTLGHTKSIKRRRKKAAKTTKTARRKSSKKGKTKLVAGSAAAKAWGAKMKRLRKKK